MKNLLQIIIFILAGLSLYAQAPESFSYQAVLRNADGNLIANTAIGMQFSILQGNSSGTVVYVERHFPTTNANGLVTITIGGGTVVSGSLVTIDWSNGPFFIKVETDVNGGSNYTLSGTSQLLSVPFALHSLSADEITGGIAETDPIFSAWDRSTGIQISVSQITDLQIHVDSISNYFDMENALTGDLLMFNGNKWVKFTPTYLTSYTESDPVFVAWNKSTGIVITESQISDLKGYLTDITGQSIGSLQDVDLTGLAANKILKYDAISAKWKVADASGVTETDPIFNAWDKDYSDLINTPDIVDSVKTVIDTTTQFLRTEVDGSVTNEIQSLAEVAAINNSVNNQIKNLTNPVDAQDAATKAYIDAIIGYLEQEGIIKLVDFSVDKTSAIINETIAFLDNSKINAISWNWDFGDGNTSSIQNPVHEFTDEGNYTVSLTTSDGILTKQTVKEGLISVSQAFLPVVVTSGVISYNENSAICNGVVNDDGGAEVTSRGVVWSTSFSPTIELNQGITIDGSGVGTFSSNIGGLTPNQTYYIRAYATNIMGSSYGNQVSITTTITPEEGLLYYWNFNSNVPATDTNWDQPITSSTGSGFLSYNFSEAFSFSGTTINGVIDEISGGCFVPRGGVDMVNNGKDFTLDIPTTGYSNISITYPTRRTSTGFTSQEVQYSVNASDWITKETIDISSYVNEWNEVQVVTIDFSSIPEVNDNENFKVKIILTGCTSAVGNNRIDNIKVTGNVVGDVIPPVITPSTQNFFDPFDATITCSTEGSIIYYTIDENDPSELSTEYTGAINIIGTTTLKARAFAAELNPSEISIAVYNHLVAQTTDIPYIENFSTDLGQTYIHSVSGDSKCWSYSLSANTAEINGYNSGELEDDWLILPGITLNQNTVSLNFDLWRKYGEDDVNNFFKVYYSTDYEGIRDPSFATWHELTFTFPSVDETWINSGNIDLSDIIGSPVYIGFRYHYNVDKYVHWQIDNVVIQ